MSRRKAEQPGKRHLMSWQQEQCATVHNDDDLTMTREREKEEEKVREQGEERVLAAQGAKLCRRKSSEPGQGKLMMQPCRRASTSAQFQLSPQTCLRQLSLSLALNSALW